MAVELIKDRVQSLLLSRNMRIGPTADHGQVARFLRAVRPVTTNHELVRVGGEGDGGYLVPDDLEGIAACFSPGVDETATFELELARRGVRCFLADASVEQAPLEHPLFQFERRYLGPAADEIHMTLDDWVQRNAPGSDDLLLQMDIEGAEYGVILSSDAATLRRFRVMVIEFHGLHGLCDRMGFQLVDLAFQKLLEDFAVVHVHPNNCARPVVYGQYEIPPVMEFTLLRRDRISSSSPTLSFPHPLDCTNAERNEDFPLPRCWYS